MPTVPRPQPQPRNLSLATDWFVNCKNEEERDERRRTITSSTATSHILLAILENRLNKAHENKLTDYDSPAWQYKLAHRNGQSEELEYIIKLLRSVTQPKE